MKIYLSRIELKGLFGYRDISWDVRPDVNILGGGNGSGKSTIFHICHDLLGYGFVKDSVYARKVESVTMDFTNGYRLIWDKQEVDAGFKGDDGYAYHNVEHGKIGKNGTFHVQRTRVLDAERVVNPDDFIGSVLTDFLSSFEQAILDAQKTDKDEKATDRTYLDVLLTKKIAIRNGKLSQILINSYGHLEEAEPKGSNRSYFLTAKDAKYLTLFNRALLDFFGNQYRIKAGMESQITMISRKTNQEIAYQDLSLGEKEVLLLILTVSNTFDAPVIMWLDEPDLGLHVDWQVKLVKCLRSLNPNIQLFISTHAPSMVEGNFKNVDEMSHLIKDRI